MKGLLGIMLVTAVAMLCFCAAAQAQDRPVSLELRDVDAAEALRMLFALKPGASYALEPGTQGHIGYVKLVDQPFETALRTLVSAAGLALRIRDGVYSVGPREGMRPEVPGPPPVVTAPVSEMAASATEEKIVIEKIRLNHVDAYNMVGLLHGQPGTRESAIAGGGMGIGPGFPNGYPLGGVSGFGIPAGGGWPTTSPYQSGYSSPWTSGYPAQTYGGPRYSPRPGVRAPGYAGR